MKNKLLFSILIIAIFNFTVLTAENKNASKIKNSTDFQHYNELSDSLKFNGKAFKMPDSLKFKKFRFNNPKDSTKIKRFFVPPGNSHPNPNFKPKGKAKLKPYVTHVQPDNMPVYVPGRMYISTKRIEYKDNMPIVVPKNSPKENKYKIQK